MKTQKLFLFAFCAFIIGLTVYNIVVHGIPS